MNKRFAKRGGGGNPIHTFRKKDSTPAMMVRAWVADTWRSDALFCVSAHGIEQSPTHTNDHGVAGAEMFGATVVDRPHALRNRLVLQVDTVNAGVSVWPFVTTLQITVQLVVIACVCRESKAAIPV